VRFIIITILCFLLFIKGISQEQLIIDSLKQVIFEIETNCPTPCVDDTAKINACLDLGELLILSDPDSTLKIEILAKELAEAFLKSVTPMHPLVNKVKELKAYAINNIGYIYYNKGDRALALEYYTKSLNIHEAIEDKMGIAMSYNNIGYVYRNMTDLPKALEYYTKSYDFYEKIGDKQGMATSYNNIGYTYNIMGDKPKALEFYTNSLNIKEEIGNKRGMAASYNNIGDVYFNLDDIPKALEYFTKNLNIREEIDDKYGLANALHNLGRISLKQNNVLQLKDYATRSYKISKELGYPGDIQDAASLMKELMILQGNYKKALEYYHEEIEMRDSVLNKENYKKVQKQQARYEYDKQKAIDSVAHAGEMQIKDFELQKKQQKVKNQKTLINSIIIGIFLFLSFLGVYLRMKYILYINEQKRLLQQIELHKQKAISSMVTSGNSIPQFKLDKNKIEAVINGNLNESDWKILNVIYANPTISNKEIADKVALSLEGTSSSLRKMYRLINISNTGNKKITLIMEATRICSENN